MSETSVVVTLKKASRLAKVKGMRVVFSPYRCFAFDDSKEDIACLRAIGTHLKSLPGLAIFGSGPLCDYLMKHVPDIKPYILRIIPSREHAHQTQIHDINVAAADDLPSDVKSVFLCETATFPRMEMRRVLPPTVDVVEPTILGDIAADIVPGRGWAPIAKNIYPIDIPEIRFKKDLDLILIDCPSRNLALMPNGLSYVSNALKKTSVTYQIFDLDIVAYHRFHIHRLFDTGGRVALVSGRLLPEDPWQAEHYDVWTSGSEMATTRGGHGDVIEFFQPLIDETVAALVEAKPKILGLSIQQCNEAISREIVRGVRAQLPDIIVIVGGFSCYNADIGRRVFPECDYMCVGEADLTVGLLVEALAAGEKPRNQPGILSRYDSPDYRFIPAPMPHNLDQIDFPKYEWCDDLALYRNYNDYQLTPIIASRGCRWSRCTFCAERFYWRIRTPENFVDELEWLVSKGCYLFMFNESDLGGMPERVMEICDEIIRRGLHRKVKLTGQLRVNKKQNRAFFDKLRAANFVALRFGIDAFSENTLRLQMKGYTVDMISQNLRDCWEAGIFTEVNWVIGVPGETEADVDDGIDLILKNRKYIGRLANINPLILVNGGVYWIDPGAHNIKFREPKDQLYAKYPRALPADSWYSINPYIDAQVRKERFERIVLALHEAGFPVGAWANKIIEDVKLARDPNRAGVRSEEVRDIYLQSGSAAVKTDESKANAAELILEDSRQHFESDADDGKPAATPPLFGVAGEPPTLVRTLETHNVMFFDGWYYAIPHGLVDLDLGDPDQSRLSGVVKHTSEEGLIALLEEASYWANTRGQYDSRKAQRASESYMRAASALAETSIDNIPDKAKIVRYRRGEFVAIDQTALDRAFDSTRFEWLDRAERPLAIEARSPMRRVATKLPPLLQQEIRRILRLQAIKDGDAVGGLTTYSDGRLIGMLLRGGFDFFRKKTAGLFSRGDLDGHSQNNMDGVPVEGTDFVIVSVVTANTLPELLWSLNGYNVVKYDGMFFGLPHGLPIDWETEDVASLPGVLIGRNMKEVESMIESKTHIEDGAANVREMKNQPTGPSEAANHVPVILGSVQGYDVITYEGWVYGIPQALGPIDLTEVDAMGMPEVIRDVSRDVVENEIAERVRFNMQEAV